MATISSKQFFGGQPVVVLNKSEEQQNSQAENGNGFLKNVGNTIKGALNSGVNQVKEGVNQIGNSNSMSPLDLIEGVGKVGAGVVNTVLSPLAPVTEPTIGKGVNYVANKISDSPQVQHFADSLAGHITERVINNLNNYNTIAGGIIGGIKTPEAANAVKNIPANSLKYVEGKVSPVVGGLAEKISDKVTSIEPSVVTELSKDSIKPYSRMAKLNEYSQAAEKAISDNSSATPMEIAGQKAGKALNEIDAQIKTAAEQKNALTTSMANTKVGNIIYEARKNLRESLQSKTGTIFGKDGKFKNAEGRVSKISNKEDLGLLNTIDSKLASIATDPTFQKVDDAIDFIQNKLYERSGIGAVPLNGQVEGLLKQTIGELNSKLKTIGGEGYTNLNAKLSELYDVRESLNKALGLEGNKGASLMKQLFSPNGTMPRKLFTKIQELTGMDLVNEATLAKFVMENVGDVRQASLLKQVLEGNISPTKSGVINYLSNKVLSKIQNPIGKAKRIIKQNIKKP